MIEFNKNKLLSFVGRTQDHVRCGEIGDGLKVASDGARFLRDVAERKGVKTAVDTARNAGFEATDAAVVVELSTNGRLPPSPLVIAMFDEKPKERANKVRETVCSYETGWWVDDAAKIEDGENDETPTTKELLALVKKEKNPFKSFIIALRIANRSVKAEFVGKMALYMLSESFATDLVAYREGTCRQSVRDMFEELGRIKAGAASEDGKSKFADSLAENIEKGLSLKKGGAWSITANGPDAIAMLPNERNIKVAGVLYATANDSEEKSVDTAKSIRLHWDEISNKAKRNRLFFVAKPIVPCDESRMRKSNIPLANIGADVAKLQVAESLLLAEHEGIVKSLMEGDSEVEGLFFSTRKPFVFGKNLMAETISSIQRIMEHGPLPQTIRGKETLSVVISTVMALVNNYPEHCPWFSDGDDSIVKWLNDCKSLLDEKTKHGKKALEALLERTQSRAVGIRNLEREEAKTSRQAELSSFSAAVGFNTEEMRAKVESVIGEGKRYCSTGYDAKSLLAMLRDKDAEGILQVVEQGRRARTTREERRKEPKGK